MRRALARLLGIAPPPPPPAEPATIPDYKNAWNVAALANAEDAILTGAESETFERNGRGDADTVIRYLPTDAAVLDIGRASDASSATSCRACASSTPWTSAAR